MKAIREATLEVAKEIVEILERITEQFQGIADEEAFKDTPQDDLFQMYVMLERTKSNLGRYEMSGILINTASKLTAEDWAQKSANQMKHD